MNEVARKNPNEGVRYTLSKELKLFLYLWEKVPSCLESQNPIWPSDNKTNHKLASIVFDLMSHDSSTTLVTFPPYS